MSFCSSKSLINSYLFDNIRQASIYADGYSLDGEVFFDDFSICVRCSRILPNYNQSKGFNDVLETVFTYKSWEIFYSAVCPLNILYKAYIND